MSDTVQTNVSKSIDDFMQTSENLAEAANSIKEATQAGNTGDATANENAINIANESFELMSRFGQYMSDIISEHGYQAFEIVLWIIRVDGLQTISTGLLFFFIAFFGMFIVFLITNKSNFKQPDKSIITSRYFFLPTFKDEDIGSNVVKCISYAGFTVLIITGFVHIFDIWAWVNIIAPEVGLAKKVFSSILGY